MAESKESARKLTALEKQIQACNLRIAGASYTAIADQVGYATESGARAAVRRAVLKRVEKLEESAEEVRHLELERLDQMQVGIWPRAVRGHEGAITRQLMIMERRAKYTGADKATKVEVSGEVKHPEAEIDFRGWTAAQLERFEKLDGEINALLTEVEGAKAAAKAALDADRSAARAASSKLDPVDMGLSR